MTNRKIVNQFATIGIGTLVSMVIGIITTPIITRMVAPDAYGRLNIFTTYSNIALFVLCLGLDQALVRYYYEVDSIEYKRGLIRKCIKYPIYITILLSAIIVIGSSVCPQLFEFSPFLMGTLCIYTLIEVVARFSYMVVRLEYKTKLYSILEIIRRLVYLAISVVLLVIINGCDVEILSIATTVSVLVPFLLSIVFNNKIWKVALDTKCTISTKELIGYAYPFIFSFGITAIFQAFGKLALNHYSTYEEVGVYSSALTLIQIFSFIQTAFNTLYAPMAIEHYTKDKEDKKFYITANQIITVIMFFVGISVILFKDIFALFLGEEYREAAKLLPFMVFYPIMYTVSETTVQGLIFMKKSKLQVVVALVSCMVSILLNVMFVPAYGSIGCAFAMGVSYIVFFTVRTVLANRYYKVNFQLAKFYILTGVVVIYATYNTFGQNVLVSLVMYVICISVLGVLYISTIKNMFTFGLDYIKSFKKVHKRCQE